MLRELHIHDLGVIAEVQVRFGAGLNAVTGETGAGKTLLMTSLSLLCGARGEARLVRSGAAEALIEAVIEPTDAVRGILRERGFDPAESELVVARRVGADGRSRAWVDGRLVPISVLGEVCAALVEIHGQGAGFALARPAVQLESLDALAGTAPLLAQYRAVLGRVRTLEAEREDLEAATRDRTREIEYLTFQAEEIERAELTEDEDVRLEVEVSRLEHAERLTAIGHHATELAGSDGAAGLLAEAHKALEEAVRLDPDLSTLAGRIGSLAAETAEAGWDLRGWAEAVEVDPARLEMLRERAALLSALKRKYGGTIADVIGAGVQARRRLDELSGAQERAGTLAADLAEAVTELDDLAVELSRRRREAATRLTELVAAELPSLALANAVFDVRCEETDDHRESGRDRVEFRFSSDRARPLDLLGKVASGGELSRAMIAVTLSLAQAHRTGVLVFDEADQGVGGAAALELARRLARLGASHQVLVVTHLPQIAAFAAHHLRVSRDGSGVAVAEVGGDGRLEEVSRMLAGIRSSDAAQAHAAELLELGREAAVVASAR